MKKKMKLTSLNEKGIEELEVEKLQNIKGGFALELEGKCTAAGEGSCEKRESFHDKFADW